MVAPVPVGQKGDMLVDLTGNLAAVQGNAANFNPDHLDQCPQLAGAAGVFNSLPTDDEWKQATHLAGRFTMRSSRLKDIDSHLKAINADHPTVPHLNRLIQLCSDWLVKKRVYGFGGGPEDGIEQEVRDLHNAATNLRNAL
jgi:hypothetical protein